MTTDTGMLCQPITRCRACGNPDLIEVLDLGEQHLSDFRDDPSPPPRFPLTLLLCPGCTLAQLRHTVAPELLYHPRYSFKSGVSAGIRADLADVVGYALARRPHPERWLDIASNDGTLLSYVPEQVYRAGIDPLAQFAAEARQHANRIVVGLFDPDRFPGEQFDVITSISMFYDLDDPGGFVAGVAELLAADGIWVVQQNYVADMLASNSVDNISHEHLAYYSLTSLRRLLHRHGLEIVDVTRSPVNGGCIRTLITHAGASPVAGSVAALEAEERRDGLALAVTYRAFAERASRVLGDLAGIVRHINDAGGRVYVLGASTRGAVLWQAAGLDAADLPAVVDINPAKIGRYMSAIGAPIISEDQARQDPPTHMLVGPWWFREAIVQRERPFLDAGGTLIFPLPRLELVTAATATAAAGGGDVARIRS